jgi:hypothetical protein
MTLPKWLRRFYEPAKQPAPPEAANVLPLGDEQIPESEATAGFMFVGAPGSGKTTMIELLERQVLPTILPGSDARMLCFDPKMDAMRRLRAIAPNADIRTSNPFDARGWSWDLQADVREPRLAVELAFTLFPEQHESQPFFSDAVRHIAAEVMTSFMLSGHEWTLADLIRVLKSEQRIKGVLRRHPQTRDTIEQYFNDHDPRLVANILSTCAVKCLRYGPVAAAWESARNRFSLTEWATQSWILILGNSEESRVPIDCLNRAIFKRATELVLNQSESWSRRSWMFIDELAEQPRLDGLIPFLKKGRSKGGCTVVAFQSNSGLRDSTRYGQYFADDVLGQIGNRFLGRIECVETAEWASRLFGDQEYEAISSSVTTGSNGKSTTTNKQLQTRRLVMPSELMSLPTCSRQNGLHGFNIVRSIGAYRMHIPGEQLFDEMLPPTNSSSPEFLPRPVEAQYLRAWTAEDTRRLCSPASLAKDQKRKRSQEQSRDNSAKEQLPDFDQPLT